MPANKKQKQILKNVSKRKDKKKSMIPRNVPVGVKVTSVPLSKSYQVRNRAPAMRINKGVLRVSHREYVRSITGTSTYTTTSTTVNPGLDSLFPWLSGIASRYEFYTFTSLAFEYVPRCSASTAGTVGAYLDADVFDPVSPTRTEFFSNANAIADVPWNSWTMNVPPSILQRRKNLYTRTASVASGDARLYDFGNLFIMTDQNAAAFGDMYVRYTVEFSTPQTKDTVQSLAMKVTANTAQNLIPTLQSETAPLEVLAQLREGLNTGTISSTAAKNVATGLLETIVTKLNTGENAKLTAATDAIQVIFPHAWKGRLTATLEWWMLMNPTPPATIPETSCMLSTINATDGRSTVVNWRNYVNQSHFAGMSGTAVYAYNNNNNFIDSATISFDIDVGAGGGFSFYLVSTNSQLMDLQFYQTQNFTLTPFPSNAVLPDDWDPNVDSTSPTPPVSRCPETTATPQRKPIK